jgi:hypothetical protein
MADDKDDDLFGKIISLPFMKGRKNLDDALDLAPMVQEKHEVAVRPDGDDYQTARDEIHGAMGTLKTAIGEMAGFAYQAQHPRGYEVLGQLVEKMVVASEKLVDMQHKSQIDTGPKTINNTLMISSSDMLNMMKDKKKEVDGKI